MRKNQVNWFSSERLVKLPLCQVKGVCQAKGQSSESWIKWRLGQVKGQSSEYSVKSNIGQVNTCFCQKSIKWILCQWKVSQVNVWTNKVSLQHHEKTVYIYNMKMKWGNCLHKTFIIILLQVKTPNSEANMELLALCWQCPWPCRWMSNWKAKAPEWASSTKKNTRVFWTNQTTENQSSLASAAAGRLALACMVFK